MINDEIIVKTYLKPGNQPHAFVPFIRLDEFYGTLTNNQKFYMLEKIAQDFGLELEDNELKKEKEVSNTK